MKLLGPPSVTIDGEPLQVDTRKAIALLAYLAVEGGRHPRDHLVELLWPASDVERARSSLRRTLSTARTALGGRWLVTDRHTATLDTDGLNVDVCRVETLSGRHTHPDRLPCPTCGPELAPTVGLVGSEFLEGFAVRGAAPFERWMLDTADRMRQRLERAAQIVERVRVDEGDLTGALEVVQRRLANNPLSEEAAQSHMRLRAWAGDRNAAVETYRRLVAVLDDELGVPPLADTTELYHSILQGDLGPRPVGERPRAQRRLERPLEFPLAGRGGTLAALDRALDSGCPVLVEGGAGMGKTRLLESFCSQLRAAGTTVLTASGTPGRAEIPFGVLHNALGPVTDRIDLDLLPDRVVVELSQLFPVMPSTRDRPAGTKAALYDALARLLTFVGPSVLVLDDLDWADAASVEALAFLVDHHARPIRLVASTTASRPQGDAPALDDLRRRAITIGLDPLDADGIAELAGHADHEVDPVRLLGDTRGVPLLVVESLRSSENAEIPESIRRLFESRIDVLSGAAAQVLDALVLLGAPTPPAVARAVSGRSSDETDTALDELICGGLVTEANDAIEVTYSHVAALVDEAMTAPRRRLVHRRCADALTAVDADPVRVARHHFEAGDTTDAGIWFERAADAARALLAHEAALDALESALSVGHPDRARLHAKLARTAMHSGDYQRAIGHYEAAWAADGDAEVAFELGVLYRRLRRWDLAAAHLGRVELEDVPDDLAARLNAELAVIAARRGTSRIARELADRALHHARRSDDPDLIATAENAAAMVDRAPGREAHLRAAVLRAIDPHVRVIVLNNLAATLTDPEDAVGAATEAVGLADSLGDRHISAAVHNTLADALRRAGRVDAARTEVTRSVELFAGVATGGDDLDPHIWMLAEL